MKTDPKWTVVFVLISLLGGISTVFAIADKFVQTKEFVAYLQSIDKRLESIEVRMERLESKVPRR